MKKYLLLIILLLIPFVVKAEDFEYTIKSKVTLEGKELEGNDFTFDLIDSEGNVVQTKKNDKDGSITFDPITFTTEDTTEGSSNSSYYYYYDNTYHTGKRKYYFYTIKQRNDNVEGMTYDEEEGYVGVYIFEDGSSTVDYLKNIEAIKKETTAYKVKEGSQIYHATEEELQGQAYAVYDINERTFTFFRDEPGKYQDNTIIDNKRYFTGFEEGYHPSWRRRTDYSTYTMYGELLIGPTKVIFEDPIKPQMVSDPDGRYSSWFLNMYEIEEFENINLLDTSEVTSLNYLFAYNEKIKTLDLSTWDTSNVTSMKDTFDTCYELEELYIDNFDTSKVTTVYSMFGRDRSLKWLNYKAFNFESLTQGDQMLHQVHSLRGIDMSSWGIAKDYAVSSMATDNMSLRYINVSTLPGLWSEAIGQNYQLAIVDLAGSYTVIHSNIGPSGSLWYNLKTKKLYTRYEIIEHLTELHDLEPATYISPNNNPEPPVFKNTYVDNSDEKGEMLENLLENPSTRDGILFIVAISLLLGFITINTYKKAKYLN